MKRNETLILLAAVLSFAFLAGACGLDRHGLKEGDSISCNVTKKQYGFSHGGNDWIFEGTCTKEEGGSEGILGNVTRSFDYTVSATWDRQAMVWKEVVGIDDAANTKWFIQGTCPLDPWLYTMLPAPATAYNGDPQAFATALGLTSFPGELWHLPFSRNVMIHALSGAEVAALRNEEKATLAQPQPPPPAVTCPEEVMKAEPAVLLPAPKSVFSGETAEIVVSLKTKCALTEEEYEKSYYVAIVEQANEEGKWDFFARKEFPAMRYPYDADSTLGTGQVPIGGPGLWRVRAQQSFTTEASGVRPGKTTAGTAFLVGSPIDLSEIDMALVKRTSQSARSLDGMQARFPKLEMKSIDSLPDVKGQAALTALPDLLPRTFESITLMPGDVSPAGANIEEKLYYFGWTVKNKGAAAAPLSKLLVECTSHGVGGCPPGSGDVFDIPALAVGGEHVLMFHFPAPAGKVAFQFKATADPFDDIFEATNNNNILYSAFSSANTMPSAAALKEMSRTVAVGEGQDTLKPAFGAKAMEKTGMSPAVKEPQAQAMKKDSAPSIKPAPVSPRLPAGKAALSRDERLAQVKKKPILTFETIDHQPAHLKSGRPFDLRIDLKNTGAGPCPPDQEYMLSCTVQVGETCPFTSGKRKIGKTIPAGGEASLKFAGVTAKAGTYLVQAAPAPSVGGSSTDATLVVAPYFIPPTSNKAVKQKKTDVDPKNVPKAMQKQETEGEGPKIPLTPQKYQTQ